MLYNEFVAGTYLQKYVDIHLELCKKSKGLKTYILNDFWPLVGDSGSGFPVILQHFDKIFLTQYYNVHAPSLLLLFNYDMWGRQ